MHLSKRVATALAAAALAAVPAAALAAAPPDGPIGTTPDPTVPTPDSPVVVVERHLYRMKGQVTAVNPTTGIVHLRVTVGNTIAKKLIGKIVTLKVTATTDLGPDLPDRNGDGARTLADVQNGEHISRAETMAPRTWKGTEASRARHLRVYLPQS